MNGTTILLVSVGLYLILGIDPISSRPPKYEKLNLSHPNHHIAPPIPYNPAPKDFWGRLKATLSLDGVFGSRHVWRDYTGVPPDDTLIISMKIGSPYIGDFMIVETCYYDADQWKSQPNHTCNVVTGVYTGNQTIPKVKNMSTSRMKMLREMYKDYVKNEKNDVNLVYNCYYNHPTEDDYAPCQGITWGGDLINSGIWKSRRQQHREEVYKKLVRLNVIFELCRIPNNTDSVCDDLRRAKEPKTPRPSSLPSSGRYLNR